LNISADTKDLIFKKPERTLQERRAILQKARDTLARGATTPAKTLARKAPTQPADPRVVTCGYDETSGRMIHGVASTPRIFADLTIAGQSLRSPISGLSTPPQDSYQYHSMLSRGCRLRVPVPLLWGHDAKSQIGEICFMRKDEEQVYVRGILYNNHSAADFAWYQVERGELSGLSCGYNLADAHLLTTKNGVRFYDRWSITEVSLCVNPKNQDCSFRIYRGD
jgi:HK97 family phage prohead protease